ncbi:MAG: hypothetical protein FWE99_05165 [Bacteroidales bacterium]|nr:hypothetical protein [Bacteroidales bacterium]
MNVADHSKQTDRQGKLIGGGVALLFHALLSLLFLSTGFTTIIPEPQDQGILVEYIPEFQQIIPRAIPGREPRTLEPDPSREVRLVQQATHTEVVPSEARTQPSTLGEVGDIERHEPPPPTPINQRALFRSRDTGDSLAEQSSRVAGNTMQAGPPDGNTREGNPDGTPSAKLEGRTPYGDLPRPQYNASNVAGEVVVNIRVDQHGNVTGANVTQTGTTVQNRILWEAAVEAALKAKFNVSGSAPVVQEEQSLTRSD